MPLEGGLGASRASVRVVACLFFSCFLPFVGGGSVTLAGAPPSILVSRFSKARPRPAVSCRRRPACSGFFSLARAASAVETKSSGSFASSSSLTVPLSLLFSASRLCPSPPPLLSLSLSLSLDQPISSPCSNPINQSPPKKYDLARVTENSERPASAVRAGMPDQPQLPPELHVSLPPKMPFATPSHGPP